VTAGFSSSASQRTSRRSLGIAAGFVVLATAACAPDPPDTYSVEAPPDATLPPLPTTIAPAADNAPEVIAFAPNGETVDVRSLDNSFIAPTIEIEAGTEIRWINGGRNEHNVLPVDDRLGWGVERDDFVPGDEYAHVFAEPGVFAYYCSIHGTKEVGMVGAVIVVEPT